MNIKKISLGFSVIGLCLLSSLDTQAKTNHVLDSIGVENKDGKEIVIHRIVAKETYYSLGRLYNVKPKEIISLNANKRLKVGDVVKIPTNRSFTPETIKTANLVSNDPEAIEYIVSANETLFTIAKRFQVSVDYITKFNNLEGKTIKAGQIIQIPQGPPPPQVVENPIAVEEVEKEFSLPPNRYGLTQVNSQGIGVWMDGLNTDDGKMLALHKTAPIGTVIKITNPMTQRTTYAKVVGKYNDNNDTRDAIIVISKATASLIGVIDKRFLVNISYGVPDKE
jgi:LysM repeat protein